jgi:hypothetical protein
VGTHTVTVTDARIGEAVRFLVAVSAFGATAVLARRFLGFHLGIPGHAGVGWMAVLVFGYLATKRRGAGTAIGLSSAALSVPLGYGHSFGLTLLTFGAAGVLLDLVFVLPLVRRNSLVGAAIGGAVAHMAKFGVVSGSVLIGGAVKNVALIGLGIGALNHLLFGLVGGFIGAALYVGGRAALRRWSGAAS